MFSREELRDIAKMGGNGAGFVSLYLNVNPVTNPGGEYAVWVKNAIKELRVRRLGKKRYQGAAGSGGQVDT
jgi:hypothetical protein